MHAYRTPADRCFGGKPDGQLPAQYCLHDFNGRFALDLRILAQFRTWALDATEAAHHGRSRRRDGLLRQFVDAVETRGKATRH